MRRTGPGLNSVASQDSADSTVLRRRRCLKNASGVKYRTILSLFLLFFQMAGFFVRLGLGPSPKCSKSVIWPGHEFSPEYPLKTLKPPAARTALPAFRATVPGPPSVLQYTPGGMIIPYRKCGVARSPVIPSPFGFAQGRLREESSYRKKDSYPPR